MSLIHPNSSLCPSTWCTNYNRGSFLSWCSDLPRIPESVVFGGRKSLGWSVLTRVSECPPAHKYLGNHEIVKRLTPTNFCKRLRLKNREISRWDAGRLFFESRFRVLLRSCCVSNIDCQTLAPSGGNAGIRADEEDPGQPHTLNSDEWWSWAWNSVSCYLTKEQSGTQRHLSSPWSTTTTTTTTTASDQVYKHWSEKIEKLLAATIGQSDSVTANQSVKRMVIVPDPIANADWSIGPFHQLSNLFDTGLCCEIVIGIQ